MEYAGFWKRFGAYWIDVVVMLPIIGISFLGNEVSRLFQLYSMVPILLFGLWFNVYLVKTYGGTPGKLLLKIKITRLDGSDVSYHEATLRYSVSFVLSVLSGLPLTLAILGMSDAEYFSLDWRERAATIRERAPSWHGIVTTITTLWVWSEFIVILTNKKRRAIHDFIAGTVVIHKQVPNDTLDLDTARIAD